MGFSRKEHWSGLPFPSPMHESEKWKGSSLVVSDSWRPLEHIMPGLPVYHQLPKFSQNHIYWVGDAIQPSHPLLPFLLLPSIPHSISLFQWVNSSHEVAKVLEFQLQHQSFQWIFRTDFLRMNCLDLLAIQGTLRVFSNTTVQKHQFFGAQFSL